MNPSDPSGAGAETPAPTPFGWAIQSADGSVSGFEKRKATAESVAEDLARYMPRAAPYIVKPLYELAAARASSGSGESSDTARLDFALSAGSLYGWRQKVNSRGETYYEGDVIKSREALDERIAELGAGSGERPEPSEAPCWCGHAKNVHVDCSLGALVGGVWGCIECHDEHFFSPGRRVVAPAERLANADAAWDQRLAETLPELDTLAAKARSVSPASGDAGSETLAELLESCADDREQEGHDAADRTPEAVEPFMDDARRLRALAAELRAHNTPEAATMDATKTPLCGRASTIGNVVMGCENEASHPGPCWYNVPAGRVSRDGGTPPTFSAGHAIGLHMVIQLARSVEPTGDEKADRNVRNAIARANEVRAWLEPLIHGSPPAAAPSLSEEERADGARLDAIERGDVQIECMGTDVPYLLVYARNSDVYSTSAGASLRDLIDRARLAGPDTPRKESNNA